MALSYEQTGKYTSERHEQALRDGKLTAGNAAKAMRKAGLTISAKEVVTLFKAVKGYEPEWHHSGFYKAKNGSTMGRTYFFTKDQVAELSALSQNEVGTKLSEVVSAAAAKEAAVASFKEFQPKPYELLRLSGSPKQVDWANKIRLQYLKQFDWNISQAETEEEKSRLENLKSTFFAEHLEAKWFIDWRESWDIQRWTI